MKFATGLFIAALTFGGGALTGCDETLEKDESVDVKRDGTVVKEKKEVTEKPDGTIVEEKSKEVDRPD